MKSLVEYIKESMSGSKHYGQLSYHSESVQYMEDELDEDMKAKKYEYLTWKDDSDHIMELKNDGHNWTMSSYSIDKKGNHENIKEFGEVKNAKEAIKYWGTI